MYTHTHTHTHTQMEYYSVIKNKILPLRTTQIGLESIMLTEISKTERQILHDFTYMWNLQKTKQKRMNKHKKTETVLDTENKQVFARGEGLGRGEK